MRRTSSISAKLEDYLEIILELNRKKGAARVRDIASALSVHKSTVTAALKTLSEKELINYSPYELATLTSRGKEIAEQVSDNHKLIQEFLTDVLMVDEDVAEKNACRVEHDLDSKVIERLILFAQYLQSRPKEGNDWLKGFASFVKKNTGKTAKGKRKR